MIPLLLPEDDQVFLERHKNAIDKKDQVKKKKDEIDKSFKSPAITSTPSHESSTISTPLASGTGDSKETPKDIFDKLLKTPVSGQTSTPTQASTPLSKLPPTTSATSSPATPMDMKSFFNNLLKK